MSSGELGCTRDFWCWVLDALASAVRRRRLQLQLQQLRPLNWRWPWQQYTVQVALRATAATCRKCRDHWRPAGRTDRCINVVITSTAAGRGQLMVAAGLLAAGQLCSSLVRRQHDQHRHHQRQKQKRRRPLLQFPGSPASRKSRRCHRRHHHRHPQRPAQLCQTTPTHRAIAAAAAASTAAVPVGRPRRVAVGRIRMRRIQEWRARSAAAPAPGSCRTVDVVMVVVAAVEARAEAQQRLRSHLDLPQPPDRRTALQPGKQTRMLMRLMMALT